MNTAGRDSGRAPWAMISGLVMLAGWCHWVQDDAFISYRYAAHLVDGHGLVFNIGERVEGYTNFLWTLLTAAGMALGLDPVVVTHILGLGCYAATLYLSWRLARAVAFEPALATAIVLVLGSNYSFFMYATSGMETQLQATCFAALAWGACALWPRARPNDIASSRWKALLLYSLVCAIALLTRLDSGIVVGIAGGALLLSILSGPARGGRRLAEAAALLLPATLVFATWFLWRLDYYGDLLPNTYYAKAAAATSWKEGIFYSYLFAVEYWYLPLLLPALLWRPQAALTWLRSRPTHRTLLVAILAWCLYLARVGGDYMEFRLLVPILPLALVVATGLADGGRWAPRLRTAVVLTLVAGSLVHAASFHGRRNVSSIAALRDHMETRSGDWPGIGRVLARAFGDLPEPPVLAVAAAGAVPYFSGFPAIDMRGLTDRWVARNGAVVSTVPGHQRLAPLHYLIERQVDLVVGHPQVHTTGNARRGTLSQGLERLSLLETDPTLYPSGAMFIEIPFDNGLTVTLLALAPTDAIVSRVQERGWTTIPLHPTAPE